MDSHLQVPCSREVVLQSPVKLLIADVLTLRKHPQQQNFYVFQGITFKKVNICGVVTDLKVSASKFGFQVDDGTGSVYCLLNLENTVTPFERHLKAIKSSIECLKGNGSKEEKQIDNLTGIFAVVENSMKKYALGDYVQVKGFVNDLFMERSINSFEVKVLPSEEEISRMVELALIYDTVYKKR